MKDEEIYQSLSRKELQNLCKKNGLPARETNSLMAQSLASYYQKKNSNISTSEEGSSESREDLPHPSPVSEPRSKSNSVGETRQRVNDSGEEFVDVNCIGQSSSTKEVSGSVVNVVLREPHVNGIAEDSECINKDIRETTECLLLVSKCDDSGEKLKKKGSSKFTSTKHSDQDLAENSRQGEVGNTREVACPPFQFYVSSEEGINICVDLNASVSDWINKVKNEVHIHHDVMGNRPWPLHDELRSLENASDQVGVDHPDGTDRSLWLAGVMPSSSQVELSGSLEGNNLTLCEPNSDVQNPRKLKVNEAPQNSETVYHGLEIPDASQIYSTDNHVMASKSVCLEQVSSPEHQSISGSVCLDNLETASVGTSSVGHGRGLPLPSEILEKTPPLTDILGNNSTASPGSLVSGDFMEMHTSEETNHCEDTLSCANGQTEDTNNPVHGFQSENGESANCKFDLNAGMEPLFQCTQEQQRSDYRNRPDSSEDLQFDNSLTGTSKRSCKSEPDGLQMKRQKSHSEENSEPAMKNLRSRKNQAFPRRSKRLVTK